MESLVDMFHFLDRETLDNQEVVCMRFAEAFTNVTDILRPVREIRFTGGNANGQSFAVEYRQEKINRRGHKTCHALTFTGNCLSELVDIFANGLRGCIIFERIIFRGVDIDRRCVEGLNAVAMDYCFADQLYSSLSLRNVHFKDISPIDFLTAFPRYRSFDCYPTGTFKPEGVTDELIVRLAAHGIWEHHVGMWQSNGAITEDGILRYCFGEYPNDEPGRKLFVNNAAVSPKFLEHLVEARRQCKNHCPIYLIMSGLPTLDTNGIAHQGHAAGHEWTFEDIPNFRISYDPTHHYLRCYSDANYAPTTQLRLLRFTVDCRVAQRKTINIQACLSTLRIVKTMIGLVMYCLAYAPHVMLVAVMLYAVLNGG
ncbi:hypothetical protein AAVH_20722 [Aphelenchoides avenae]|nr:hypothetical protein AAVH_20722 [Aphelenchus avenae]